MEKKEIEKSKSHILIEIIDYFPNSILSKTIIRKTTGNVSIIANDTSGALDKKISPFDIFIQVIDGMVEIIIDGQTNVIQTGEGIIIPAHTSNSVRGKGRFKMISTMIKSGYDESIL